MNIKKTPTTINGNNLPIPSLETKNLKDEIGIPELELLYFDDFNFETGTYTGISKGAKSSYYNDLEKFYTAFTNGQQFPNKVGIIIKNNRKIQNNKLLNYFKKYGNVKYIDIKNNTYLKFATEKSRNSSLKDKNFQVKKWKLNHFLIFHYRIFITIHCV